MKLALLRSAMPLRRRASVLFRQLHQQGKHRVRQVVSYVKVSPQFLPEHVRKIARPDRLLMAILPSSHQQTGANHDLTDLRSKAIEVLAVNSGTNAATVTAVEKKTALST